MKKKQALDVDSIIKLAAPEERIYRHRCVEGWSIVVPWIGFPLSVLINRAEPEPKAKFVKFTTDLRSQADAGTEGICVAVALCGRLAHG